MNWLHLHRRSAWIIGLSLLLPALLYVNVLFNLLGVRQEFQSGIESLEPRLARLQGLINHQEQLSESAGEVDRRVLGLVYPAADDRTTVAAKLQKDVRQMLVDAGLSVSNSQVLPVREKEMFDYVSVKLTVTGDIAGLNAALVELAAFVPLVLVESLDVWPRRDSRRGSKAAGDDKQQSMTATLQLLSLRAAQ